MVSAISKTACPTSFQAVCANARHSSAHLLFVPDILLLDEPFSALDYQTRLSVSDEIGTIIREEGKTAILVTHDISEAISLSDRVVVLSKRPASLKKIFPIQFSTKNHTPMQAREAPEFKDYFNAIWKELDVHVS